MSQEFAQYNADLVSIVFGALIADGFGPDEFVTIERTTPRFTSQAGANGHVARSQGNDNRAKVTLTLIQTSAFNDLLSAAAAQDALDGLGVRPLTVRDRNGRSLHYAEKAWIAEDPNPAFAREAGTRVWVLECANLESFVGGS